MLGEGSFGQVFLARNKDDMQEYAVKKTPLPDNDAVASDALDEIRTLVLLQSRYVVQYYNAWVECADAGDVRHSSQTDYIATHTVSPWKRDFGDLRHSASYEYVTAEEGDEPEQTAVSTSRTARSRAQRTLYIQMEVCRNKTLREFIYGDVGGELLADQAGARRVRWRQTTQLIQGLSYIHQQRVTHRDIKPENVFLTEGYDIKYGDFGISIGARSRLAPAVCGTKLYMAPEMFSHSLSPGEYQKCDVYALGITLYELWALTNECGGRDRVNFINTLKNYVNRKYNCAGETYEVLPSQRFTAIDFVRQIQLLQQ